MRDPYTGLPDPVVLDDAPRVIEGQQGLPLFRAGYSEPPRTSASYPFQPIQENER